MDIDHDEQFGFTDDEVMKLLSDYDRSERYPDVKEWYDGYHFGNADIYCPWDVIKFAKKLVSDPSARPSAFWINSSGNDIVKRFVDKADRTTSCLLYTSYDSMWQKIIEAKPVRSNSIPGAFVKWDNTPRHGERGQINVGTQIGRAHV